MRAMKEFLFTLTKFQQRSWQNNYTVMTMLHRIPQGIQHFCFLLILPGK